MFIRKISLLSLVILLPLASQADYICTAYCLHTYPKYTPRSITPLENYTYRWGKMVKGSGSREDLAMAEVKRKCNGSGTPIRSGKLYDDGNRKYMTEVVEFSRKDCKQRTAELQGGDSPSLHINSDEANVVL